MPTKAAKPFFKVDTLNLYCPYCTEILEEPGSGSQMWMVSDIAENVGKVLTCPGCERPIEIQMPKRVTV